MTIHSLEDKMKACRVRWFEHVQRIDETRVPKQAFPYKPR
jgi:hypothetical protein